METVEGKGDMSSLEWQLLKVRLLNRGLVNSLRMLELKLIMLGHLTPRRVANLLLVKAQKWLRRDKVWGMPFRYNIDPINVCNLRCPLCPTGSGTLKRDRGKLDLEGYQRIIDQIAPYAYLVELYNWGESFLHPQIFDMIRYASERNIFVRISSNLNRFDRDMAEKTVTSGLDALIVSVDGVTEATYQQYRRRGKLSRVIENIGHLVEAKKQAKSRLPFITLRMLVNRYNEHEIKDVRRMAAELGIDAFTTGTLFVDTKNEAQIEEWLPQDESFSYYDYTVDELENVWHCADLWESMSINWDGGVSPCCWIHNAKSDLDNVLQRPIKDIWNDAAYFSSRRVFAFGGAKPGPQKTICSICKGWPEYLNY